MKFFEHDCPSCRCPNTTGPSAWAQANLTQAPSTLDHVKIAVAYWHYRTWTRANLPDAPTIPTQNKFTRWLTASGHRVETVSGANHLIGYRLAS